MVRNNSNGAHGSAKPCREICLGFSECLASVSCRVRCLGHSPLFRCLYSCEDKRVVSGGHHFVSSSLWANSQKRQK